MSPFFSRLIVKLLFYTPSTKCSLINCTSFVNIYQKYWFQFFDMFPRHRLINIIIRLNEFLRYLQISPDFLVSFKILTRRDWQILHLLQNFVSQNFYIIHFSVLPLWIRIDTIYSNSQTWFIATRFKDDQLYSEKLLHIFILLMSTDVLGVKFSNFS